jgi:alkylhydroperoxidase/carboxymuconolactone decarboxylase family protein YurZ
VPEDQPVLNTLAEITAVSVARGTLDAREHMLARLAALVAIDAPAASYALNVEPSAEVGLTVEDVQGLLIAIAPIVGTPRVVSAAGKITDALGFVIDLAIAEAELEAELDAEEELIAEARLDAELDSEPGPEAR